MKKLFNFRPLFFFASSFSFGIVLGLTAKTSPSLFPPLLISAGGLSLISLLFAIIKRSQRCFSAVLCCVFLFSGLSVMLLDLAKHERAYLNTEGHIEGIVTDNISENIVSCTFFLRDVTLTVDGVTYPLSGFTRASLPVDALSRELSAGDHIRFFGSITAAELFMDGAAYTNYYKNNVKYIASGTANAVELSSGEPNLTEAIRIRVKENLYERTGEKNGAVLYALLFGDKSDMDSLTYETFRDSGVIHLLAVSGLHVSFLSAMLLWMLEKLKVKRVPAFLSQAVIFISYAVLCGFAPSVMRAALMALVMQFSKLVYRRYDLLSSIGFSALIILAFRPLLLFDAGFLFTYGCMFGIAVLMPLFEKAFSRMPKFLRVPLAMSLSVQIALLPLSAYFFGKVSLFATLLNLFAVPVITGAFFILLPAALLSPIFSFLGALLYLPSLAVSLLLYAGEIVVSSGIAVITVSSFGLLALGFYIILYIGRFMLLRRDRKAVICTLLALLFFAATLIANLIPKQSALHGRNSITAVEHGDSIAAVIATEENRAYLVLSGGNKTVLDALILVTDEYGITAFDALILTEVSAAAAAATEELLPRYQIAKIILPYSVNINPLDTAYYLQIEALGTATVLAPADGINLMTLEDISFSFLGGARTLALSLRLGDANIVFLNALTEGELMYTFTYLPSVPSLILTAENFDLILMHYDNALVIYGNKLYNYHNTVPADTIIDAYALTIFEQDGNFSNGKAFTA